MRRGESQRVAELSQKIITARSVDGYARALAMLRNIDLANGREADAVDRYRSHFPGFFLPDELAVDASNYKAAAGLAVLLHWTGAREHAPQCSTMRYSSGSSGSPEQDGRVSASSMSNSMRPKAA